MVFCCVVSDGGVFSGGGFGGILFLTPGCEVFLVSSLLTRGLLFLVGYYSLGLSFFFSGAEYV